MGQSGILTIPSCKACCIPAHNLVPDIHWLNDSGHHPGSADSPAQMKRGNAPDAAIYKNVKVRWLRLILHRGDRIADMNTC